MNSEKNLHLQALLPPNTLSLENFKKLSVAFQLKTAKNMKKFVNTDPTFTISSTKSMKINQSASASVDNYFWSRWIAWWRKKTSSTERFRTLPSRRKNTLKSGKHWCPKKSIHFKSWRVFGTAKTKGTKTALTMQIPLIIPLATLDSASRKLLTYNEAILLKLITNTWKLCLIFINHQ